LLDDPFRGGRLRDVAGQDLATSCSMTKKP
jgi:hypothetical protein